MTETIRERGSSAFNDSKDESDTISVFVFLVAEFEFVTTAGVVKLGHTIDIVFLTQFRKEKVSEKGRLVGSSFVYSNLLVSGSTAVYSQYCS